MLLEVQDTGCGMSPGHQGARLRTVLHDEGPRRHRPWSLDRLRHREAEWRVHLDFERAWPRHDVHDPHAADERTARDGRVRRTRSLAARSARATILLTEDDPDVRQMLATLLRTAGHTVLAAENADRALATAASYVDADRLCC